MSDFHFIRPLWLLAIFALILALYLLKKYRVQQSGWQQLLPKHLATVLIDGQSKGSSLSLTLPFIIGVLTITALAGPTWQKLPQPVYQVARGSVLIMDMSYSMYATDISPNRLTRARYKAIDLLNHVNEGEIGLVAYAGDAFVISPLTEDISNIELLLPSLTPDLMPALGSNPYAALTLAGEMLMNAGHIEGDIYWFTDGIDNEDIQDITDWSRANNYRLNILGIGTKNGAPIKLTNGELMKDNSGAIVVPKLTESMLKDSASRGGGHYVRISNDQNDIEKITSPRLDIANEKNGSRESENTGDQWQEAGPYLVILILPLLLGYFRRGSLLAALPLVFLLTPTQQAQADIWQDLWKTKDQQGQIKYNQEAYSEAANKFQDPMWQGSAHYKAGNYEAALSAFEKSDSAEALYNQGNSLAKLQKFDEAINAYDQALAKNPDLESAKANKALIEQLKEQQEQQQSNDQQNDQNNEQQNKQDSQENQQKNQQSEEQQESQEQKSDQSQQQDGESSPSESESEEQKQQKEEQKQGEEKEQQEQQEAQPSEDKKDPKSKEQQAKIAAEQLDKETQQKHKQLLNKVTDDPYLLLRNKMQLEYQKRRHNNTSIGETKKW